MKKYNVEMGVKVVVAMWFITASILAIDTMRASVEMEIQDFVWELFKVVVGPFLGATLAFSYNRQLQDNRRREEEEAEIYGAAASIQSMYSDFLRYRRGIHDMASDRELFYLQFEGVAPVWAYAT
ncbi:hypothetical protein [Herbaspirillum aquaticum]|jgi:hypothetical protein|uniref:hypothetical protein n=1 Tax=Herbaspirillum aquaticum TaxID=568783 RepID=UPI0024DEDCF2|nr:hypothetical protein [Herbaspirillum aquaticum]